MRYLMMKRVMLAILLPFLVGCLFGAKALSEYWVVWFFVCAMLMITAWGVWLKNKNRGSSFSYLNDNEDGVFIYKFHNQEMRLDKAKKQLYLKDGLNEKTYAFSDVESWEYNISAGGQILTSGLNPTTNLINNKILGENINDTGFFIKVKDIKNPEWHIRFFPQEGSYKDQKGLISLKKQMMQWMAVFDLTVNADTK